VVAVGIPETVGHRYDAYTRFDQPPSDQQLIVPHRSAIAQVLRRATAIAVAHGRGFAFDVQRGHELAGGEDIERPLVEGIQAAYLGAVHSMAEAVELLQEPATVGQLSVREVLRLHAG